MDILEKLKDEKLERLKNKYFGIWRGVVTNVNDPLNLGRIKAKVHELLGDKDETNWASYCAPFGGSGAGWFFLPAPVTADAKEPQAGDGVWVMFEAGDINRPVWTGFWYSRVDAKPKGADKDVRVLQTKSGHRISFDDRAKTVRVEDSSGQFIEWQALTGRITIEAKQKVIVKAEQVSVESDSVDLGKSDLSGVICKNTHPVCYYNGRPIGCSQSVRCSQ